MNEQSTDAELAEYYERTVPTRICGEPEPVRIPNART